MGLTFLIRRLQQQPPPTSQPRGCLLVISRLSTLAGLPAAPAAALLRTEGCRLPPAALSLRAGMEPAKGKGQSAEASPPAPTLASEGGSATETGVVRRACRSGSALLLHWVVISGEAGLDSGVPSRLAESGQNLDAEG